MRHQTLFTTIVILGLSLSPVVKAQEPFGWQRSADGRPFVSAQSDPQEVRATSAYSSTIYAVGTDEVPSDAYNPYREGQQKNNAPGIRKSKEDGAEYGQSDEYPIGEPLVLLAFVALFAGVITWRRVRKLKVKS